MSRRTERIASTMQRQLQTVLARGLQDPRIKGMITLTRIRVTEDLTTAVISVSVYPAKSESATIHGLRAASGFLRRELARSMALKKLPQLQFELDSSVKREAGVLAALDRVRAERQARESSDDPGAALDAAPGDPQATPAPDTDQESPA